MMGDAAQLEKESNAIKEGTLALHSHSTAEGKHDTGADNTGPDVTSEGKQQPVRNSDHAANLLSGDIPTKVESGDGHHDQHDEEECIPAGQGRAGDEDSNKKKKVIRQVYASYSPSGVFNGMASLS